MTYVAADDGKPIEDQRAIVRAFDRGVTHFHLANNYGSS
jgi:aryl-alcohol dehydrogenase-like predicted oxidoreductase